MNARDLTAIAVFVATGAIMALAFRGLWLFGWIGLAIFACAVARTQHMLPLVAGAYLGGLLFNLIALDWTFGVVETILPLTLVHIMALAWPVTAVLARRLRAIGCLGFATSWTVGTAVPIWVLLGILGPAGNFHMNRLAQTQLDVPIVQIADVAGMTGVEFVMAFTAAAIAYALTERKIDRIALLLLAVAALYGVLRMDDAGDEYVTVALHSGRFAQPSTGTEKADLAIWPEGACAERWHSKEWLNVARNSGTAIICGINDIAESVTYNRVVVTDGREIAFCRKHYLVAGHEAPSPFDWMIGERKGLSQPGDRPELVRCCGLALSVPICYEVTIPRAIPGRPDIIVNPGSERRLRGSGANAMLSHARLRAIETRRSVVRATANGFTAIIDGDGRVLESAFNGEILGRAPLDQRSSIYSLTGDWLLAASVVAVVWPSRARQRTTLAETHPL